jgi:hypothetical protein
MDDHIAALEAALQAGPKAYMRAEDGLVVTGFMVRDEEEPRLARGIHGFTIPLYAIDPAAVLAEVKRLREELAATEARADLHADLSRRTAEALGIPLEEGRAHMPEVAKALQQQNEALKSALLDATAYMLRHGGLLATDWGPATSDATRHEGEAIVEKARRYVLLAEQAAQAAKESK